MPRQFLHALDSNAESSVVGEHTKSPTTRETGALDAFCHSFLQLPLAILWKVNLGIVQRVPSTPSPKALFRSGSKSLGAGARPEDSIHALVDVGTKPVQLKGGGAMVAEP